MRPAKLWLVHLWEDDIPEEERQRYEKGERRAATRVRDKDRFETSSFWELRKSRLAEELQVGDWIIQVVAYEDGSLRVYPPGQFLLLDSYVRPNGKMRHVFRLEVPKRGQNYRWDDFRRKARRILGSQFKNPRIRAIRDPLKADPYWICGQRQGT